MKKYVSRFHYLTQDMPGRSHTEQVNIACQAGANWIQYRCYTKTDDELISEINQIAAICDDWGTTLILTQHYHLLDRVDAQGVHIENVNTDLAHVRQIIGADKTLGASAITTGRLLKLQEAGMVDYCGFGPFAHTDPKFNNYPFLGLAGFRELQDHPVTLPVIAVGGIQLKDVDALMETGIAGIAVSGAINNADDPAAMLKAFYQKLY
ncbi:thiamine phosphate synthase [Mucilaginibacter sp. PPCGB 2223]|uniref:thiamine phosphate synthase n=1 Tax=Mucilaginibacter sp. PPCGB 2223 TaxID=1886027 RepID=UPI000824BCE7|nr:thiamine phosphate synthase [Mucilaginibacter sp. PPCGB 2223]OCX51003.1 thiamine phosphate synthase [Mucilaginibacter sp. PPCGB 2223]